LHHRYRDLPLDQGVRHFGVQNGIRHPVGLKAVFGDIN
jgi:hypothetical protein